MAAPAHTHGDLVLGFDHHRTMIRAGDPRTGRRVATTFLSGAPTSIAENEANAAEIVKRWNAHGPMLAALKDARNRFHAALVASGTDPEFADIACAAYDAVIHKAEGTPTIASATRLRGRIVPVEGGV